MDGEKFGKELWENTDSVIPLFMGKMGGKHFHYACLTAEGSIHSIFCFVGHDCTADGKPCYLLSSARIKKLSSRGLNETLSSSVSGVHWMGLQTNL